MGDENNYESSIAALKQKEEPEICLCEIIRYIRENSIAFTQYVRNSKNERRSNLK